MKKNESLFYLIKSLSRSEKRYIKLLAGRSTSPTNYIRLFEVIDRQESYDEGAIRRQFEGEAFLRQLHVTKNYLRTFILKCLRSFHTGLSKNAEVKDALRNVEILFHKELYIHCADELRRAESIARRFELHPSLTEILSWKRKLEQARAPHHHDAFATILKDQEKSIGHQSNTNRYWQIAVRFSQGLLDRRSVPPEDEMLLKDPQRASTLEAKVLFYNARYFRHLLRRESGPALDALYAVIQELELQPHCIEEDPALYVSSINNLVSYLIFQKDYEKALAYLERTKTVYESWKITSENKTLLKHILRTYNIELELYRDTRAFDKRPAEIERIKAFVISNKNKMPQSYLISFWFQLANIYFEQQRLDQALTCINELLNTSARNERMDLQIQARMLNMMIHLEKQNLFVLRYFVDSTRRFLKKMRPLEAYENELLRFFSNIANAPLLEYNQRFATLQQTLFPSVDEPLVPPSILDYIDYKNWIERWLAD